MNAKRNAVFTDAELKLAAAEVRGAMLAAMPSPVECEHEFSPEFEEKMRTVLAHEKKRRVRKKWLGRAAGFLLALVLGGGVWLASDQSARAGFRAWVQETYENVFVLRFRGTDTQASYPSFRLTWLPEDCTAVYDTYTGESSYGASITNRNAPERGAYLRCYVNDDTLTLDLNVMYDETYTVRPTEVNGAGATLCLAPDDMHTSLLVWQDETGELIYVLDGYLTEDALLRIAEGVEPYGFDNTRSAVSD